MTNLKEAELFQNLTGDDIAGIEPLATLRKYPKNTIIIEEGDESATLFIIRSGSVKVSLSGDDGKEFTVAILTAGKCVGEMSIVDRDSRSARVTTLETSEFYVIRQSDFSRLLRDNPVVHNNLLLYLCRSLRSSNQQLRSLALMDVYGRVASTLLALADDAEDGSRVANVTQQELANRIGASREMVNRILKDLETGGHIKLGRGYIRVNERLPERW